MKNYLRANIAFILQQNFPDSSIDKRQTTTNLIYAEVLQACADIEIPFLEKISKAAMQVLFPYALPYNIDKFYLNFYHTLVQYQINTIERLAAFCSQLEIESGSLQYVHEIADGSAYEYRKDLGNLLPEALKAAHAKGTTTGRFYKGRGLIQVTGFYNYKECGKALGIDLINHPELLEQAKYACLSAGWYWNTHNCNSLADIGDIKAITRTINGGYTALDKRIISYNRNLLTLRRL